MQSLPVPVLDALARRDAQPSLTCVLPVPAATGDQDRVRLAVEQALREASELLTEHGLEEPERARILAAARAEAERCLAQSREGSLAVFAAPDGAKAFNLEQDLARAVVVDEGFALSTVMPRELNPSRWYALLASDAQATLLEVVHGEAREVPWDLDREDREDANRERVQPIPGGSAHGHASGAGRVDTEMNTHGFGHERVDAIEREVWYRVIADGFKGAVPDPRVPVVLIADTVHIGDLPGHLHVEPDIRLQHDPHSASRDELLDMARARLTALHTEHLENEVQSWFNAETTETDLEAIRDASRNARVDALVVDVARLEDVPRRDVDVALRETLKHGGRIIPASGQIESDLPEPVVATFRW